jgi:hypothetical protein
MQLIRFQIEEKGNQIESSSLFLQSFDRHSNPSIDPPEKINVRHALSFSAAHARNILVRFGFFFPIYFSSFSSFHTSGPRHCITLFVTAPSLLVLISYDERLFLLTRRLFKSGSLLHIFLVRRRPSSTCRFSLASTNFFDCTLTNDLFRQASARSVGH